MRTTVDPAIYAGVKGLRQDAPPRALGELRAGNEVDKTLRVVQWLLPNCASCTDSRCSAPTVVTITNRTDEFHLTEIGGRNGDDRAHAFVI